MYWDAPCREYVAARYEALYEGRGYEAYEDWEWRRAPILAERCSELSDEDRRWMRSALLDSDRKWFVALLAKEAGSIAEALFPEMIRAAVYETNPSFNGNFIEPCGWARGQLAVYTALLDYLEHGTDFEKAGAIHATYWAHIGKAPCTAAETEALQAVRERLAAALLREFVENTALDVRRSIIPRLNLDVGSYPDDLKPLVRRARAIAVRHPDNYIRHRASVQMGHELASRPLPHRASPAESDR